MKKMKIMFTALAIAAASNATLARANSYGYSEQKSTVQALLGGVRYDDLVFTTSDGGDDVTIDMSTLPQLGGAWGTIPKGERIQFGLEASFLLGFQFNDVNTYSGTHAAYVDVSSSLWTFDIAGGVYANLPLGSKLRLYAGAGPLLMVSIYNSDTDYANISQSETATGWGAYARTGLELKVHQQGYLGAGLRGNWCDIDFTSVGGPSEISGIAAFVTYTVGL